MINKTIACDVLVVGAGVSGVCAAVSACRNGSDVILLEKNSFSGGTAVIAMHRYICGLQLKGLGLEIFRALNKLEPKNKMISMGRAEVFPIQTKNLENAFRSLLKAEDRLRVFYNAQAVSLEKKNNSIVSVSAFYREKFICIKPRVVIDASGEGTVIRLSKAKYNLAPAGQRQLQGFSMRFKGIEAKDHLLSIKVPYCLRKAVELREILKCFRFTTFVYGSAKDEGFCKFNIPYINGFNINKNAAIIHNYLRKVLPELKNSYIAGISSSLLEREGLRLSGDYILTKEDVLGAKKFKDSCARGNWPVEFWHQKNGQQLEYLKPGKYYEIPLRCLHSKHIKNLFATGRCISATPAALASTRVMGTCIALGEAAGKAASNLSKK